MEKVILRIRINKQTGTYHPIYYREAPLPGNPSTVNRFKSGGMHPTGFDEAGALAEVASKIEQLKEYGYEGIAEIDSYDEWDGNGDPIDIILR